MNLIANYILLRGIKNAKTNAIPNLKAVKMKDPIAEVGDLICEILTFSYSDEHQQSLRAKAREDGATLEQMLAAAIAHRFQSVSSFAEDQI